MCFGCARESGNRIRPTGGIVSLAMEYGPNRGNRPISAPPRRRRFPRWLLASGAAAIVIAAACTMLALMSRRPVAIENPERQMAILLKDCKISISLKPTQSAGQIITGRDGAEWYAATLTPVECDALIEALRARVDGKSARVTIDRAQSDTLPTPTWWTPQSAHELFAFEIDPPTYWIGVAKDQNKLFLRHSR
jgi:hypothetical protein